MDNRTYINATRCIANNSYDLIIGVSHGMPDYLRLIQEGRTDDLPTLVRMVNAQGIVYKRYIKGGIRYQTMEDFFGDILKENPNLEWVTSEILFQNFKRFPRGGFPGPTGSFGMTDSGVILASISYFDIVLNANSAKIGEIYLRGTETDGDNIKIITGFHTLKQAKEYIADLQDACSDPIVNGFLVIDDYFLD